MTETLELNLPYSREYVNIGRPIKQENLVEFRLIYEGELLSSGNRGSTVGNKHAIRKFLHPQLRRLWKLHAGIRQYARHQYDRSSGVPATEDEHVDFGINTIGRRWQRAGFDFVPLVTDEYALRCALDILLLRPSDERFILRRGDLDGQVKTLFDALRIADNADETDGATPTQDETPFYCLLSDDRLISEVRVIDDRLLLLPHAKQVEASDAFAVIDVKVAYQHGGTYDRYFE
jgi:hypothetical protein